MRGGAGEELLDTYSMERVHAARQNIAYGAKSTEFMAPPSYGFSLMRDAVLRLALFDERGGAATGLRALCAELQPDAGLPRLGLIELNSGDGWQVLHDGARHYGSPANAIYVFFSGRMATCWGGGQLAIWRACAARCNLFIVSR